MTISAHDRARLREEETLREELGREQRRQRRPRLLAMAAVWALILTAMAFGSAHFLIFVDVGMQPLGREHANGTSVGTR